MKKLFTITSLFVLISSTQLFAQLNIELLGQLSYDDQLSNLWGWADGAGNEYAIVGTEDGTSIVDITNPALPVEVQFIDGNNSIWREIAVYDHYAYVVTEADGGLLCIDLSGLPDADYNFTECGIGLTSGHTVKCDENGVVHVFGSNLYSGGDVMLDATADPLNPTFLGAVDEWYIHDGFARGDTLWAGNIYAGQFSVWDITDKDAPELLGQQSTPSLFTHNIWVSDDGNYAYTTDEVSDAFVASYDVSDVTDIKELDKFQANPGTGSIPHNTYVVGNFIVTAYYKDGVVITDVTNPSVMIKTGEYDTSPFSGSGFNGCWGVYPYLPSGNIIASDMEEGLFILGPTYVQAAYLQGTVTDIISGAAIFDAYVSITADLTSATNTDLAGDYSTGTATAGTYTITFSAPGYDPLTVDDVTLNNGEITVLDVELMPLESFALTGEVIDAVTGDGISGADVLFVNPSSTFTATTDAGGTFFIPAIYTDIYDIYAGSWGYVTKGIYASDVNSDITVSIVLNRGYYDDYIFDFGWTATATASRGLWERAEPAGTFYGPDASNPDDDVTDDYGMDCYVTGNGGGEAGDDDVDDGSVTLVSPAFDLTTYADPYINYSRWYYNGGGAGTTPNDSLKVYLSNGTDEILIDEIDNTSDLESMWNDVSIRVADFIDRSANMHITFICNDAPEGHLSEAAVDKFFIVDSLTAAPTAAFTSDNTSGCVDFTVNFDDISDAATAWNWSFPGGSPSSSTISNPTVTYSTPGEYDVTLIATNDLGSDTITMSDFIIVHESPAISVSAGVGEATVSITGGTPPYDIMWDDALSQTTETATGLPVGTYNVTVTDANGCQVTSAVVITQSNAIDELLPGLFISINPNPFIDQLIINVDMQIAYDNLQYEIKDITGKIISADQLHTGVNKIMIDQSIAAGIYVATIHADENGADEIKLIKIE